MPPTPAPSPRSFAEPAQGAGRKRKLSEVVAQAILEDIVADGWRTGAPLGTEPELIARFQVSRATLREAVRQLERHGAARMKRGAGGGLVVSEPPRDATVKAMTTFLQLTHVSLADQHEVRVQLDAMAARLAATRATPDARARLRSLADATATASSTAERVANDLRFRAAVAEATGNPSLTVFIEALDGALSRTLTQPTPQERTSRQGAAGAFARRLFDAIAAEDPDAAEEIARADADDRLRRLNDAAAQDGRRVARATTLAARGNMAGAKLSDRTARQIARDIIAHGLSAGDAIGAEADLQRKYKVSRATLREAIRQLEPHGIVRTQIGFNGGLVVGRVETDYTVELACLYLVTSAFANIHLWETQSMLERFAARKLASAVLPTQAEILREHLAEVARTDASTFLPVSSRLHMAMASLTGNRALALFDEILLRFGEKVYPPVEAGSVPWLIRTHRELISAICNRNVGAAEQIMTRIYERSRVWIEKGA